MKKLFLMAAFAATTMTVSAQTWIGGEIGYSHSQEKDADNDGTNHFKIAPEIGYNLNEDWAIAVALNYDFTKESLTKKLDETTNVFTVNPYVRYNYAKYNDVTFFVDGGLGFGFGKVKTDHDNGVLTTTAETKTTAFEVGFKPGIAYSICDKCGLVAHFGFLGYDFNKEKPQGLDATKTNSFGFDFSNNVSFGVYVNL